MVDKGIKVDLTGDWWIQTLLNKHARTFGTKEMEGVAKELAKNYRAEVLRTLKSEGRSAGVRWEPMAASTRATKRGRKLLSDEGLLRRSLKIHKESDGYFVGYKKGQALTSRGVDLATVAATHEEGRVMRILVTEKMVKAFMAKLSKYGKKVKGDVSKGKMKVGQTMVIRIPARSFLQSTYVAHFKGKKVSDMALESLKKVSPLIRGLFSHIKL